MEDNEFYTKVWRYSVITFCVFMTLCFGSCQNTKFQIVRMVEAGASPAEAACALGDKSAGQFCAFTAAAKP